MFRKLRLERFKNFKEAELVLGPFTLLVGANASGKSNLRDAFRFLHGIGRGYSLPEIFGEKWMGGEKQWDGIRGGIREVTYQQSSTFVMEVHFDLGSYGVSSPQTNPAEATYRIEVGVGPEMSKPRMIQESLYCDKELMFDLSQAKYPPEGRIDVQIPPGPQFSGGHGLGFISNRPVLSRILESIVEERMLDEIPPQLKHSVRETMAAFNSIRFLNLSPDAMRQPSTPGQTVLTDRGENLSSVLQAICEDSKRKATLIEWLAELTPMNWVDLDFSQERTGKVLVELIEGNRQRTSVYSASDGTLRFLGLLAALLAPEPSHFYFIEELENSIHPARLHLLLDLIERRTAKGNIQMVATTHSPHLLGLVNDNTLEHVSLTYRLPDSPDGRMKRMLDIPDAKRLIKKRGTARLLASGWLEDVVDFLENMEATS